MRLYANSQGQKLLPHLQSVAKLCFRLSQVALSKQTPYAKQFGGDIGEIAFLSGILHDVGKAGSFAEYILAKIKGIDSGKIESEETETTEESNFAIGAETPRIDLIDNDKEPFSGALHHEISWAMVKVFSALVPGRKDKSLLEDLAWAVYFHHTTPYRSVKVDGDAYLYTGATSIFADMKPSEIRRTLQVTIEALKIAATEQKSALAKKMLDGIFCAEDSLVSELNVDGEFEENLASGELDEALAEKVKELTAGMKTPNLVLPDESGSLWWKNATRMLIRGSLVQADRMVSRLDATQCDDAAAGTFQFEPIHGENDEGGSATSSDSQSPFCRPVNGYIPSNDLRSITQERVSSEMAEMFLSGKSPTSICSLPAGYGKTRTALQWASKVGAKQIIWFVPRNSVAEAVYSEIEKEAAAIGLDNLSIELFLTGRRQKSNAQAIGKEDFSSDIVVTNIDSLLAPSCRHGVSDRIFRVATATLVGDEYQEFVTEAALFSSFSIVMRLRHALCAAPTLLLSATPLPISFLWEMPGSTPLTHVVKGIAPFNSRRHAIDFSTFKTSTDIMENRGVVAFNAVRSAQKHYLRTRTTYLAHSKYSDRDKRILIEGLLVQFGQSALLAVRNEHSLSAAPIIRAAFNISTNRMTASICAIWDLVQLIGRFDRWGENEEGTTRLSLVDLLADKSEAGALQIPMPLAKKTSQAFAHFATLNDGSFTFPELYAFFDDFMTTHEPDIKSWISACYETSLKSFAEMGLSSGGGSSKSTTSDDETTTLSSVANLRSSPGVWATMAIQKFNKTDRTHRAANALLAIEEQISFDSLSTEALRAAEIVHTNGGNKNFAPKLFGAMQKEKWRYPMREGSFYKYYLKTKWSVIAAARTSRSPLVLSFPASLGKEASEYNEQMAATKALRFYSKSQSAPATHIDNLGLGIVDMDILESNDS